MKDEEKSVEHTDERGMYRGMFSRRWDDSEFRKLPPNAKLVLLNLETSSVSNLARIFPLYREPIEKQTGLPLSVIDEALNLLCERGWTRIEDDLVWIVNALKDDPLISPKNKRHVKALKRVLGSLPNSKLVQEFCSYYKNIGYAIAYPIAYGIGYPVTYAQVGSQDSDSDSDSEKDTDKEEEEDCKGERTPPVPPPSFSLSLSEKPKPENPPEDETPSVPLFLEKKNEERMKKRQKTLSMPKEPIPEAHYRNLFGMSKADYESRIQGMTAEQKRAFDCDLIKKTALKKESKPMAGSAGK